VASGAATIAGVYVLVCIYFKTKSPYLLDVLSFHPDKKEEEMSANRSRNVLLTAGLGIAILSCALPLSAAAPPPSITASNITQTGFRLSWPFINGASSYTIQWSQDATFTAGVGGITTSQGFSSPIYYDIGPLNPGTLYYFRGMTSATIGNSGWSAPGSATTLVMPTATPIPPTPIPPTATPTAVPTSPPTPVPTAAPAGPSWHTINAPSPGLLFVPAESAAVSSKTLYGVVFQGDQWMMTWYGSLASEGVYLRRVSMGSDGTRWGVNGSDAIYRCVNNGWGQIAGALHQIAVGSASNVWGVNAGGSLYKWTGTAWSTMGTGYENVTAAGDGTVIALKTNDSIWRLNGSTWTQMPGALRYVAAGSASNIWGVNSAGTVYKWNGATWLTPAVPAGTYMGIAAGSDGSVILTRSDGSVFLYY
jgi:hypothetical protein